MGPDEVGQNVAKSGGACAPMKAEGGERFK